MYSRYEHILAGLQEKSNFRRLPSEVPASTINLSSNDYLGLASDKKLYNDFIEQYGKTQPAMSSSSSRLLTGNCSYYAELEQLLALSYKRDAALVYNSGYHANIGILPALVGKQDLVLADKLVHASIIDGLRLCAGEVKRYNHCNYEHLERLLRDAAGGKYEQIFIVTESVFSMDGDVCDLAQIVSLKKQYNAFLYVDEAHAVGALGCYGLGQCEVQDVVGDIDFIVGTFGKALASHGAFVVCDSVIRDFLINTSRSLIFSTALPPVSVAWTLFAYQKQLQSNDLRLDLAERASRFRLALNCSLSQSHIIPHIVGQNEQAVALSAYLRENGIHVMPIRHPTVPHGTARLRFSLTAQTPVEALDRVVDLLHSKGNS